MPGGLINIATYGSQDLFLTGTPEITYFKLVYRRHTNFGMESVRLNFDDSVNFNKISIITIPKAGDLLHKTYLEVILPEIYFSRTINQTKLYELNNLYSDYLYNYEIIRRFMQLNMEAYIKALNIYELDNVQYPCIEMINAIIDTFTNSSGLGGSYSTCFSVSCLSPCLCEIECLIDVFKTILENTIISPISPISCKYVLCKFYYSYISLLLIVNNPTNSMRDDKEILKLTLDHAIKHSTLLIEYYQWLLLDTKRKIEEEQTPTLKGAWVKRIGHSLIEYVTVYMGGDVIDKQYGEWIDIWYELTANREMENSYMKMIGNIPELTTFDRTNKPRTVLYIPLLFWFNRHNGQALPLISMQYHDIQIGLKVRKFSKLFYVENTGEDFNLDVLYEDSGLQLNVNLLTDFIYLDTIERRKFAQSGHEYLIDVIQYKIDDNDAKEYKTTLEFNNPSKEIIWIAQRKSLLTNPDGTNECQWTNYGTYLDGTSNPCATSQIFINGAKLSDIQKSGYYNNLIPYYSHTSTPVDGINCYSFALMPEEYQPSGSCNMSNIRIIQLFLEIDDKMLLELDKTTPKKNTIVPEIITIKIFSVSQNILRIIGGMASLAFS